MSSSQLKYLQKLFLALAILFPTTNVNADTGWITQASLNIPISSASSPYESCQDSWQNFSAYSSISTSNIYLVRIDAAAFNCWATLGPPEEYSIPTLTVNQSAGNCSVGIYDFETYTCKISLSSKQKGNTKPQICSYAGDPINFAVGNNYQSETDYSSGGSMPLIFSRSYNSLDGFWRDNYSTHLRIQPTTMTVVMPDGREINFSLQGQTSTSSPDEIGQLNINPNGGWIYTDAGNNRYTFNNSGELVEWSLYEGLDYHLTRVNTGAIPNKVTVTDNFGRTLSFSEDAFYQPRNLQVNGWTIGYSYHQQYLSSVIKIYNGQTLTRKYEYEDSRDPSLLTGITDERGVRFATWSYDAQGRTISSEHAGMTGKVLITYNSDGSTTVTNELGKKATYQFITLNDVKQITAIQGEPTPNCPASDSSYSYDQTRGLLTQKTDAKGVITQYAYNPRGLETQRIEGVGSAQPRTTTTEWDPSRFLRTKVAGPTHTTVYTYDAQGRQLTQVTTPNPAN